MQFEEAYIGACVEYTGSELTLETTGQIIAIEKGSSHILVKFPDEDAWRYIGRGVGLHNGGGRDRDCKSLWFGGIYSLFSIENLKIVDVEVINLEEE